MKIERGRAEVARQAHNLKVVGSNPIPATMALQKVFLLIQICDLIIHLVRPLNKHNDRSQGPANEA